MQLNLLRSTKYRDSVVFHDASWRFYRVLLRELNERPTRINYDRGTLEMMTLSIEHERYKGVIGLMLGQVALTYRMKMTNGGSSTLKRLSKRKGLEADQCYWIANEAKMRTKKRIDLRSDPPPDLVVEIDVMHSVVNREKICASLGVPEMWVLRRDVRLTAFVLKQRKWAPIENSLSFPFLRVADLNPFVARIGVDDDTSILADFSEWLQALRASGSNP